MHGHQEANIERKSVQGKEVASCEKSEYISNGYQKICDVSDNFLINGFLEKVFEWIYFQNGSLDELEGPVQKRSSTKQFGRLRELGIKESRQEEKGQLNMLT